MAVPDFRRPPAKFRRPANHVSLCLQKGQFFLAPTLRRTGAPLALQGDEHHVFRATLVSIVLTLAVGQDASVLCQAWCHDATPAACTHHGSTTSPSVSGDDSCGVVLGAATFVREDARRTAAAPDAQNALVVPRFLLPASPNAFHRGVESLRQLPLEEQPLLIALRI